LFVVGCLSLKTCAIVDCGLGILTFEFWILDLEPDSHEFTNKSQGSGFSLSTYYYSLIPGQTVRTAFSSVRSEMFVATASNIKPRSSVGATEARRRQAASEMADDNRVLQTCGSYGAKTAVSTLRSMRRSGVNRSLTDVLYS